MGTGFVTGAYALWLMTAWTPDISQWDLVIAGFIQGISIGLLAIPINVIAFATLSPQLRTEATGVYSLVRNLGSAIGISVTAALLESNTQVNHAILSADASPFNRALQSGTVAPVLEPRHSPRGGIAGSGDHPAGPDHRVRR